jgi:hypothetical protein
MNSPVVSNIRSTKPALELISLATMTPEAARQSLRALLLSNPDYFGKITNNSFKVVLGIQRDTAYESIGHVCFDMDLEQLQATIHMNGDDGYSDEVCKGGSTEHVRFYLSYDGGSSWLDVGVNSFNVCNRPGTRPRQEAVAVGVNSTLAVSILDRLPVVRAILSWNVPPPKDMPEWVPVWGDVLDARIDLEQAGRAAQDFATEDPGISGMGGFIS